MFIKKRILIADDHDLILDVMLLTLSPEGYDITTATTFTDALDIMQKQNRFDLILLDYHMPGMDGLKGLKTALNFDGGQQVALFSGVAGKEVVEKALEMGIIGFIPKTLHFKSMVNAIRFMMLGEQYVPLTFEN